MEKKLTREEVLHVASLAHIALTEEEIAKFQYQLKKIMSDTEKINDLEITTPNILITPTSNVTNLRDDVVGDSLEVSVVMKNVPKSNGNFIEVPVVVNE